MKKLALALILLLSVLMISCPSPETEKPEASSIDWEPVPEDGKIKAENLTSEHLYSVLINESEARNLIRSTTETESNKNIFPTNYGTWLFFPDESGSLVIDISQDLNVNGASGQGVIEQVQQGLQMSLREFEQMINRVVDQKMRRSY